MSEEHIVYYEGSGADRIVRERARQVLGLGYDEAHDDSHDNGEIAQAASFYAMTPNMRVNMHFRTLNVDRPEMRKCPLYPFDDGWFSIRKFEYDSGVCYIDIDNRIAELAAAGALAAAEIDRLLRIKARA